MLRLTKSHSSKIKLFNRRPLRGGGWTKILDMKKFLILSVSLILLILSCKKEDNTLPIPIWQPGPMTHGYASATKVTEDWLASAFGKKNDWSEGTVSVLTRTFNEFGEMRELLSFQEIPLIKGKYGLTNGIGEDGLVSASYATLLSDGDVVGDFYQLDTLASDNYIEVTYVDTTEWVIKGSFSASFIIDLSVYGEKLNPANPDRVKFSDGSFDVKIIE